MYWFMQFASNPVRALLGVLGLVLTGTVLVLAIGESPHAAAVLGSIWAALLLLVAVRVPLRFVLALGAAAFFIIGVVSLISEVLTSGVLPLVLIVSALLVLGYLWLSSRAAASHRGWSYRPRRRRRWSWL